MVNIEDFRYLEGLEFVHGSVDCYQMPRRIFKDFHDIDLTNYARPDDWWTVGENLYEDNFRKEGFFLLDEDIRLEELKPFDCFLIAIPDNRSSDGCTPTNHCAVYLGDGMMIHHRFGKRSQIKLYKGMMKQFTTGIVRHKDIIQPELPVQKLDLMDYILPHKRRLLEEALNENS